MHANNLDPKIVLTKNIFMIAPWNNQETKKRYKITITKTLKMIVPTDEH